LGGDPASGCLGQYQIVSGRVRVQSSRPKMPDNHRYH